nr:MAG TPA: hypothetical protein [Caudoviricetes sp.]
MYILCSRAVFPSSSSILLIHRRNSSAVASRFMSCSSFSCLYISIPI